MPRNGRPAPLNDSIFRPKEKDKQKLPNPIGPVVNDVPEELPVHNTFIQFGATSGLDLGKQLSTAPAWIGPSIQSMIQAAIPAAVEVEASPKKVPVMRYSLSASSARACGVPTANAVVASYEPWLEGEKVPPGTIDMHEPSTTWAGTDESEADIEHRDRVASSFIADLGDLPSLGSEKHAEGLCKRCCFFPKGRCQNGKECEFCHFPHEKRKRKKKKKKKSADKDGDSDSEDSDGEDEGTSPADGAPQLRQECRRGDSSASGKTSPRSNGLSFSPPRLGGLSASQLSALEPLQPPEYPQGLAAAAAGSQVPQAAGGTSSSSPKADNIPSIPSTASSVPNWPRPPYEADPLYGFAAASPMRPPRPAYEADPLYGFAAASPYSSCGYAPGVPPPMPPPPALPPGVRAADMAAGMDLGFPPYAPPYQGGSPGYTAGAGLAPQAEGSPFGGRPPPR